MRQQAVDGPADTVRESEARAYWRRQLAGVVMLVLLCLLTLPFFYDPVDHNAPMPKGGTVSYKTHGPLTRPVTLQGDWGFQWLLPVPEAPGGRLPKMNVRVPGLWEGQATPIGTRLPQQGRALYTMKITDLPAGRYQLYVPPIYGGNRVYIDGRLLSQRGVPGNSAASTRYFLRAHEISFETGGGDLDIGIETSAYLHRDSGMDSPPVLGLAEPMEFWTAIHWAQEVLFHTALVLLALYGLAVFLFRRSDKASLYFSLSCFLFIAPSCVLGFDNLLLMAFPQMSFPAMLAWTYLPTELSLSFFLAYGQTLFPQESPKLGYRILLGMLGALIAAQLFSFIFYGTLVASQVNKIQLLILVAVFSYLIVVLVRAVLKRREGALVFLLGIFVFFVSLMILAVVAYGLLPRDKVIGVDFTTYGILVLLFSHIIVLAERWSLAIQSAERTTDDLRRLLDVNLAITSEMQLEALLTKIINVTSKILNADRSSLLLYDEKTDELWSMVAEGLGGAGLRFPADEGLSGHALKTGETVNVPDAYADPRFIRRLDETTGYKTTSILSMPVTARDGRRIGVMQALNHQRPGPFGQDDIERMAAFAAQAAVAIDNARLFKEVVAARNYNDSVLRSMTDGLVALDRDLRITTFNEAASAIMGVRPEVAMRRNAREFLSRTNPVIVAEIDAVAESGQARRMIDIDIKTARDNLISANVSIVPLISDGEQAGTLIVIEDISQGKRLEGAMRRFMTQEVVDQVMVERGELLFGTACHASVLFADIRNFTSLAETLEARATVDMLNEVFTDLFEAVAAKGGVLDKFIGDALMAVYGAPITSGRDPDNAVASAIQMQGMIAAINTRRAERGLAPLKLGVGIASGDVVAGTIGSPKRMDYTVIGDSVNLAARLEVATKFYEVDILICEATAEAVMGRVPLRALDNIRVRGRQKPARIYEVLTGEASQAMLDSYEQGRAALRERDWEGAVQAFSEAAAHDPSDRPSAIMLERARALLVNPPPPDWDRVWDS